MTEYALDDAFSALCAGLVPVAAVEDCMLADARGRVLAQPLVAALDLPAQDIAAMDGFAVRATDLGQGPQALAVRGSVLAGHPFAAALAPGQCVRIMTGAPLPAGADAVVVMEVAQTLDDGRVLLPGPVAPGANRRRRGEHVASGQTVLAAGRQLRNADLALAAGLGCASLPVFRRVRVGILSTGDELRDAPAPLAPGAAYDSNRPMLRGAVQGLAMDAVDLGICPDDAAALEQRIDKAFGRELDALLISGGAALGDADVVRALGAVEFVPVNLRPGRGIAVARLRRGPQRLLVLGLPGNAVAAYVLAHLLALPVLARLGGATARPPRPVLLPLAHALQTRAGRVDYRRARLLRDAGERCAVEPLPDQGSAMIRSVSQADALLALGPQGQYAAGAAVPVYLLSAFESPDQD